MPLVEEGRQARLETSGYLSQRSEPPPHPRPARPGARRRGRGRPAGRRGRGAGARRSTGPRSCRAAGWCRSGARTPTSAGAPGPRRSGTTCTRGTSSTSQAARSRCMSTSPRAARLVGRQVCEVGVPTRHQVGHERQGPRLERHAEHQQVVTPVDVVARRQRPGCARTSGSRTPSIAPAQRLLARWLQRAHRAVGVERVRRRVRPARLGVPVGVDLRRRRGRTTPWMSRACAHRAAPSRGR